ncbi:hypothetical protein EV378_5602 [Pseudonocardia endophytica]|uniref:Uncharacterized protein n=1 Tax=Pseudonocardia endophytica TaxID=401976 RepID=A0A4R1HKV2_PSEEN|nr:hypothetical protein EV378_5602 [Pseudonocardia endophytica]
MTALAPGIRTRFTHAVMRTWLEPFWPSRRVVQFDEFCRTAA